MKKNPENIDAIFCRRMQTAGIAFTLQQEYRKWLRFYLDFCNKYYLAPNDRATPEQFMQKLHEKGQSAESKKQAFQSVKVYLDIIANEPKPNEKQKAGEVNDLTAAEKMLGHTDVRTTMIYTNTVRSRTLQDQKSPLDF